MALSVDPFLLLFALFHDDGLSIALLLLLLNDSRLLQSAGATSADFCCVTFIWPIETRIFVLPIGFDPPKPFAKFEFIVVDDCDDGMVEIVLNFVDIC